MAPTADLAVTISDTPDPVLAGENLTYTIAVTNDGPDDAENVQMTSMVAAGTSFVSFTAPGGWTITTPPLGGTGVVAASRDSFDDGASATFTLVVQVNSSTAAGTILPNTAEVTSTNDPDTSNNTAPTTTIVATEADLSVTMSNPPSVVADGSNVTYSITVTNHGPSDALVAELTNVVPANTTFVSFTAPGGWNASTPPVGGTGTVSASLSSLAAGATAAFTLVVNVNAGTPDGTLIVNTASVSTTTDDPILDNNSDTKGSSVNVAIDLEVEKSAAPDPVPAGGTLTYTIIVTNKSTANVSDITLFDAVPSDTAFVSFGAPPGWTSTTPAVGGTGNISSTGNLAGGASATFTLVVNVNPGTATGTIISNTASVPFLPDPTPTDNSATATAEVLTLVTVDFFVDSRGLFEDHFGGNEKWLRGDVHQFGNPWYYILPNGDIFEWDGSRGLNGVLLHSLGPNSWENPELLVNATPHAAANPAELETADQARAFYRSSTGNFFFDAFGGQEKWIKGMISVKSAANQNNPWYFILPDGSVHEWDGTPGQRSGTLVAEITPDVSVYKDPSLLYDAFRDATVNSDGWDEQRFFFFDNNIRSVRDLWENDFGADEKWFRGNEHQFGNDWYFVLPNGELYEWDGQRSATGNKLADLGPNAWNNLERMVGDFQPVLDQNQTDQLIALDQQHRLFRASNDRDFYFNVFNAQEKWLRGETNSLGNPWYILLPGGVLLAWDGSGTATGIELATDLPLSVYDDPLVLANAFADGSVLDNAEPLHPFQPNNGGPGDRLN